MTRPDNPATLAELSGRAVLLGMVIGVVMTAANTYLGLYAGMTVSASIPAAIVSMGVLRGLFKHGTILENNIVQTMASAGESVAAGIIFTVPALVIAGVWDHFPFWKVTAIGLLGGVLGVPVHDPAAADADRRRRRADLPRGRRLRQRARGRAVRRAGTWRRSFCRCSRASLSRASAVWWA